MKIQQISYDEYKNEIIRIYRDFRREMYYYPLIERFLEEYVIDKLKVIPVYDNKGYNDDNPGLHDRSKYADSHSLQDMIIVPEQYEYEKTTSPYISIEVKKPDIKFNNREIVKYDLMKIEGDNLNQLNAEFKYCNYIIFTDCIAWYFLEKGTEIGEPVRLIENEKWTQEWNNLKTQIILFESKSMNV